MHTQFVEYSVENRIAHIKLNRPDKRNALNALFVAQLKEAFQNAAVDKETKMLVLSAYGDAFCAGADLAYLQDLQKNTYEENLADSRHLMELFKCIYEFPKMVIAAVEGPAIAGGCGLATVCDIVFAADNSKFGYTEVKIGFAPAIVSVYLMRKVGESVARDLLLSGRIIDSAEAKSMGLIHYICKEGSVLEEAVNYATKLNKTVSADSLRLTRELIAKVQEMPYSQAFDFASEMNAKARETEDCKKGIAAFLNKEKLTW